MCYQTQRIETLSYFMCAKVVTRSSEIATNTYFDSILKKFIDT